MHCLFALTSFITAVAAIDVQIAWRLEKSSNISALGVYNAETGDLLAEACGSLIDADIPIDFSDVSDDGYGNFTVGDESFLIHTNPDFSGGPECSKTFNPDHAIVQCSKITWSAEKFSKGDVSDCFEDEESYTVFHSLRARDLSYGMHSAHRRDSSDLDERQYCSWAPSIKVIGDDTVQNYVFNTCGPNSDDGDPYVMYSPNDQNRGGGYYCVVGTCRSQGDQYWDKTGRAGGP
ncbi:hypothetical protein G7Z17_g542 [Cylindrodendrum hubeiense]|uniref:Uncharacterized protein n=1 Tax=Cylindrodendrum hubeiense TaxID=595255 RepID=A0A9P5LD97_9HYPO|nr:hypothetical protein G7Z17_g542 [Cylindrodendrum hubeiense]